MALIKSIDDLRKYTKVNRNMGFETLEPYVRDAQDKYLLPAFGAGLLDDIENKEGDVLHGMLCRSLAPFTLALASDEMSINFGESGHTVSKSETVAPASDAKIARAAESLYNRGWTNLERALKHVVKQVADYPEWILSEYYHKSTTALFSGSESFQDDGLVDIDYNFLTFVQLRTLIIRVEKAETLTLLPADLSIATLLESSDEKDKKLVEALQAFTGSRVAAIHTAQATRRQRAKPGIQTEHKTLIRPLYEDLEDTGNYFETQANIWLDRIMELLISAGHIEDGRSLKWNSEDKKIFVAGALKEE